MAISLPEQPVSKGALIRLPSFPDGTLPAGLAIALAWSLAGIVGVILPAQLVRYNLPNWSGPLLFIFVMTGVLLQPYARRLEAVLSLQLGAAILVLGYITFTCGAWLGVLGLVLAGVAIAPIKCCYSCPQPNLTIRLFVIIIILLIASCTMTSNIRIEDELFL